MKYIVIKEMLGDDLAREIPIIFPVVLVHRNVWERMQKLCSINATVIAAGEVSLFDGVRCHGKSETLNLKSREGVDERLIRMNDYGASLVEL